MESCFLDQSKFTEDFVKFNYGNMLSNKDMVHLIEYYCLSMHKEISEVLDTCEWKKHIRSEYKIDMCKLFEELIDVQKFLWGLMSIVGMDKDILKREYWKKTEVVRKRWNDFIKSQ